MAKQTKRIQVIDTLDEVSPYDLDGMTPDQAIDYFTRIKNAHGADVTIDWDPWFCHPYESERSPRYFIKRKRLENDSEYEVRLAKEKATELAKKERDLAELERLQKLYGKGK